MRTGSIVINKKEYVLCFSARVVRACTERYGSIDNIDKHLLEGTETQTMDESVWLLEQMIAAGDRYAKQEGIENPAPLSYDEIYDLCGLDDLMGMRTKIFGAIADGNERKVEVETNEADEKNMMATQQEEPLLSGASGTA